LLAIPRGQRGQQVEAVGRGLARYGLAVVVAWIGLMKFTAYEAEGISPFVAHSPHAAAEPQRGTPRDAGFALSPTPPAFGA
jgi:hypothetical protein